MSAVFSSLPFLSPMIAKSDILQPQKQQIAITKLKSRKSKIARFTIQSLRQLEAKLSKMTEIEFREYAKNDAIKAVRAVKTDEGYVLVIDLTWKPGPHTLYTFRNRPRAWVSLDRMMAYMERHQLHLNNVTVQLHHPDTKPPNSTPEP